MKTNNVIDYMNNERTSSDVMDIYEEVSKALYILKKWEVISETTYRKHEGEILDAASKRMMELSLK